VFLSIETQNDQSLVIVSEATDKGALHFGPYINVAPGQYAVSFTVEGASNAKGIAKIDVATNSGTNLLAERTLYSMKDDQTLIATLDEPMNLEFRVWTLGNETVTFKSVNIERVKNK